MEAKERITTLLEATGAAAFGFVEAGPVEEEEWNRFEAWLRKGYHAGMLYMENYPEIRRDPRLLLEGAKSIVSVAYNYRQPNPFKGKIATYALGQDYHKVIRKRLKVVVKQMRDEFGGNWRICIDSAPILERYWAQKAGVGHRSPIHGNIIVPGIGSMVFLAEIITTLPLHDDSLIKRDVNHLENDCVCCPGGALLPGGMVNSGRCINYLTIEKKDALSQEEKKIVGGAFFGCDICQTLSRENKDGTPYIIDEFRPLDGLEAIINGDLQNQDLKKSPVMRKVKKVKNMLKS